MAGLKLPLCSLHGYLPPTSQHQHSSQSCSPIIFLCDTSSELNLVISKEYGLDLTTFTFLHRVKMHEVRRELLNTSPLLRCSSVCTWLLSWLVYFHYFPPSLSHAHPECIFMDSVFALSAL